MFKCLMFKSLKCLKTFRHFLKPQNCVERIYIASIRFSLLFSLHMTVYYKVTYLPVGVKIAELGFFDIDLEPIGPVKSNDFEAGRECCEHRNSSTTFSAYLKAIWVLQTAFSFTFFFVIHALPCTACPLVKPGIVVWRSN